jgi:Uri superfamily endonuclease
MKGIYVLLIELPEPAEIKTLSRTFTMAKCYYAYVGSAMNNLQARIARHLSKEKKQHWHIDYLLDRASVRAVISAQSDTNAECLIAKSLSVMTSVAGFGCSDCRCRSHLFYSTEYDTLAQTISASFEAADLEPARNILPIPPKTSKVA